MADHGRGLAHVLNIRTITLQTNLSVHTRMWFVHMNMTQIRVLRTTDPDVGMIPPRFGIPIMTILTTSPGVGIERPDVGTHRTPDVDLLFIQGTKTPNTNQTLTTDTGRTKTKHTNKIKPTKHGTKKWVPKGIPTDRPPLLIT